MDNPKIDVVIPCFCNLHFINDAIASLLSQTYPNWKCVVVDDGMCNADAALLNQLIPPDPRISILHKVHEGVSATRNRGFSQGEAPYLVSLDSDDLFAPTYFERAIEVLIESTDVKIVYGRVQLIGNEQTELDRGEPHHAALQRFNMIVSSAMFRRKDYERVRGYDPEIHLFEDWDLWLSILTGGGTVRRLPTFEIYYRKHCGSTTANITREDWVNGKRYVMQKHAGSLDV